jgi:hypothetical protein
MGGLQHVDVGENVRGLRMFGDQLGSRTLEIQRGAQRCPSLHRQEDRAHRGEEEYALAVGVNLVAETFSTIAAATSNFHEIAARDAASATPVGAGDEAFTVIGAPVENSRSEPECEDEGFARLDNVVVVLAPIAGNYRTCNEAGETPVVAQLLATAVAAL